MENQKIKNKNKVVLTLICLVFAFSSCKTVKTNSANTSTLNCKCNNVIKSFVLIEFRYNNKDTLIGPNIEWNDGTFEENEHVLTLKRCTDLEIEYTPIKRAIKGYYVLRKSHLIYCEKWIEYNCPNEWSKMKYPATQDMR